MQLIRRWAADSETLTFFPVEGGAEVPLLAYPHLEPLVKQVALLAYLVLIYRLCHWFASLELVPFSYPFYTALARKPYSLGSNPLEVFLLFVKYQEVEQILHRHPHPLSA